MLYEVRFINGWSPGVFMTQAHHASEAASNCRLVYPNARIVTVIPRGGTQ
jgi:hypothetical protein